MACVVPQCVHGNVGRSESVLFRPKFDNYISLSRRLAFYESLRITAEFIESAAPISACRDPKDDKFLALALTGHANFILTGNRDLLILHPFRHIDILSPRQYLDRQKLYARRNWHVSDTAPQQILAQRHNLSRLPHLAADIPLAYHPGNFAVVE